MIESLAANSVEFSAARMAVEYSMAMTDKVLEAQESAAQGLMQMLPTPPAMVSDQQHLIDLYA